ncbi:cyclic nucleotide-binding domain-containing thioredoxin-disulfide reductase [Flavobacterium sp. ASW18X]|uniref:FAD-dependent oxidoreductase n=1 Tax=Flavobacterium sp. ASW18X TaxID=2572595 RepID=UPI0010ADCEB7|nr:cyclic nucleotide-binding domain-containing thioredoxin-disulfide reductase [Flavobacterium sp. ASW18X]TKD65304.1 cyclic nucleotide-binding domain-containing protein [Flavobacterium sp. ASW18X]
MKDEKFPELTARQIAQLKQFGTIEHFSEGTTIIKAGDQQYDFFVVMDGQITIENPANKHHPLTIHKKNEFTGDSGMLSHRSAQFNGIAQAKTCVLRLTSQQLKEAIAKHSEISDVLLNAFLLRQETVLSQYQGGLKLIGSSNSKETYAIRDFMDKNHLWYNFLDVDASEDAEALLTHFGRNKEDLPFLINSEAEICQNPSLEQLATYTGVLMEFEDIVFDLLIIGAGPAGLAASVYAASEGLNVVTIDSKAPGGQAGKSSKIENYLGFPTGISGSDLANRAYVQAQKFGCNISIPHRAEKVTYNEGCFTVTATNNKVIQAKAVIAATGAEYRQLPLSTIEKYEGSGVFYSATGMNASACKDELVGVVGGGNSAGQAALFLADHAKKVFVILRGEDLGAKMSDYLVQRILAADNITVLKSTEVKALHGQYHLESVVLQHKTEGEKQEKITNLFTFIGAKPCTDWVVDLVETDEKGFICTGPGIDAKKLFACEIFKTRKPQSLETSIPGFFAVGDVRKGSVKRVASAVGEGSMAVSQVHQYLADLKKISI